MKQRMSPDTRKEQILHAAIDLAQQGNLYTMSGHQIGKKAMCARGLINHYFMSLSGLRNHVILWGIQNNEPSIIAQVMSCASDELADKITVEQRKIAANYIKGR